MYNNKVGVIRGLERLLNEGPEIIFELGIDSIQLSEWNPVYATPEVAKKVKDALQGKVQITSVWGGWSGPRAWNFHQGPELLGIVPEAYRETRLNDLERWADFTEMVGAPYLASHMGFMPEQPCYAGYKDVVAGVHRIADYCQNKGIGFNFETGQETPTTLMRVIQDAGNDNLGINLDPANLIMYGRGNPIDAIDVFGSRIKGIHVKDGNYPKGNFYELGEETQVCQGSVNWPVFLPKLLRSGYKGDLYIERETTGEQNIIDVKETIKFLRKTLSETD
ncbi:MAG: sugar phosphate isomerase/epimerase [Oscillospiraceae bacterium]|nr:sugar phosphate isomerase/epimerase [Oscillospiraceae bacterium]